MLLNDCCTQYRVPTEDTEEMYCYYDTILLSKVYKYKPGYPKNVSLRSNKLYKKSISCKNPIRTIVEKSGDEIWRTITWHNNMYNDYDISNHGRIRNRLTMEIMPTYCDPRTNLNQVSLGNTTPTVAHLVANEFVPNLKHSKRIRHINGDNTNDRFDNLEWI